MTFDLPRIFESKRLARRARAALPIAEKLRMLDALRERELVLRRATPSTHAVHEKPAKYRPAREA